MGPEKIKCGFDSPPFFVSVSCLPPPLYKLLAHRVFIFKCFIHLTQKSMLHISYIKQPPTTASLLVCISRNTGEVHGHYCIVFGSAKRWVEAIPPKWGEPWRFMSTILCSLALGHLMACSLFSVLPLATMGIGTCDTYGISSISAMKLLKKKYERECFDYLTPLSLMIHPNSPYLTDILSNTWVLSSPFYKDISRAPTGNSSDRPRYLE